MRDVWAAAAASAHHALHPPERLQAGTPEAMQSKPSLNATELKVHACSACECNQEPAASTGDVTHLRIHSLTHDGSLADHNPDASPKVPGPTNSALLPQQEVQPAQNLLAALLWSSHGGMPA